MFFFKAWFALQPENQYYAYDVTSFSGYFTNMAETEWGYNRDKGNSPNKRGMLLGTRKRFAGLLCCLSRRYCG
jgi:hypothetical protein